MPPRPNSPLRKGGPWPKGQVPEFQDAEFMPAAEKRRVFVHWERFLRLDLRTEDFTQALYHHLTQRCDFIAHYGLHEFYAFYFSRPEDTRRFLQQFDRDFRFRSAEGCFPFAWLDARHPATVTYVDVNRAMCDVLEQHKAGLYERLGQAERERDLAVAKALLAKHGLPAPSCGPPKPAKPEALTLAV